MLCIMNSDVYRKCIELNPINNREYVLINFNSSYELSSNVDYNELDRIFPSGIDIASYGIDVNSKEFDINYANYLVNDIEAFHEVLFIVFSLHCNKDVIILTSLNMNDYNEGILQSLCKFIQQRYGIITNWCYTVEDYEFIPLDQPIFNLDGLFRFDQDRIRIQEAGHIWR